MSVKVAYAIKTCRERDRSWLRLDGLRLETLPEEIYDLKHLRFIEVNFNKLKSVPDDLWDRLPNLMQLSIIGNPVESLPDRPGFVIDSEIYRNLYTQLNPANFELFISDETTLIEAERLVEFGTANEGLLNITFGTLALNIGAKKKNTPSQAMQKVLQSIKIFKELKSLTIRGFHLNRLPESIRELKSLTSLRVDAAELAEFPEWIAELPLEHISAISNNLNKLPSSFPS